MLTVIAALVAVTVPTYVSANNGSDLNSTEKTLLKSGEPLTVGLDAETGAFRSAEKALPNSGKPLTVALNDETGSIVSVESTEGTAHGVGTLGATNP